MRCACPSDRLPRAAVLALLGALCPPSGAAAATFVDTPTHLVILTARADGVTLRLLLDTGDPSGLSIDATAAERLGLAVRAAPATSGGRRGLLGPLPEPLGTARIDRLSVDDAAWEAVEASVIREDATLAAAVGAHYDGVIGTALLAGRCLVLDYPRGTLKIGAGAAPCAARGSAGGAALRHLDGHLVTDVDLGRGRRTAIVDTASAATFVDVRGVGSWRPGSSGAWGLVDAGGSAAGLPAARIPRLAAGGTIVREFTALGLDLSDHAADADGGTPPAAILGADLLSRHRVVLDLVAGRFALEAEAR